jgi:predicted esterase
LLDAEGKALVEQQATLEFPAMTVQKVHQRIGELLASSPHPLFARHLKSLDALVRNEWARAVKAIRQNPAYARDTVFYAGAMLKGLDGDQGKWQTYLDRKQPLTFSHESPSDHTFQMYKVTLPDKWDDKKACPMIVSLHGAGNPNPIFFAIKMLPGLQDVYAPQAYIVEPWGRGNMGYRGLAEDDVLEAMADAGKQFKIDPDRTYLMGHSMGGLGTWSMGLRMPDRFAAIGISAGFNRNAPTPGIGENACGLPVRIWHGRKDDTISVEEGQKMNEELKKYGQNVTLVIDPDKTHQNDPDDIRAMQKWLLQFTRKLPGHFAYMADTDRHLGRNGITMKRDASISPMPRFECDINGNEVSINATGASEITVDLGSSGLGLAGEATVILNGKEAYQGPVKQLVLKVSEPASKSTTKSVDQKEKLSGGR